MITRGGEALILPATLATPAELAQGVRNIEALCGRVARDYLKRRGAYLSDELHADLASYLMLAAWKETSRYQPGWGTLVGYLSQRLAWRCTDWYRTTYGRAPRVTPTLESLDVLRDELRAAEEPDPDEPVAA